MKSKFKIILPLISLSSITLIASCNISDTNKTVESNKINNIDKKDILIDKESGYSYALIDNKAWIYSILHYVPYMDIKIPTKINNKEVVGILYKSFSNKSFNEITFPSTLQEIEKEAFLNSKINKLNFDGVLNLKINNTAFSNVEIEQINPVNVNKFIYDEQNKLLSSVDKKTPYFIKKDSKYIKNIVRDTTVIKQLDTRLTPWTNLNNLNLENLELDRLVISNQIKIDSDTVYNKMFKDSIFSVKEVLNFSNSDILSKNFKDTDISFYTYRDGVYYLEQEKDFTIHSYDLLNQLSYSSLSIVDSIANKPVQSINTNSLNKITDNFFSSYFELPESIKHIKKESITNNNFSYLGFNYAVDSIETQAFKDSETEELFLSKDFVLNYKEKVNYSTSNFKNTFSGLEIKELTLGSDPGQLSLYDLKFLGLQYESISYEVSRVEDTHSYVLLESNTFSFKDASYSDFARNKRLIFPKNVKGAQYNKLDDLTINRLKDSSFTKNIKTIDIYNDLSFLDLDFFLNFENLEIINIYEPVDYSSFNINSNTKLVYKNPISRLIDFPNSDKYFYVERFNIDKDAKNIFIPQFYGNSEISGLWYDTISNSQSLEDILISNPSTYFTDDAFKNLISLKNINFYNPDYSIPLYITNNYIANYYNTNISSTVTVKIEDTSSTAEKKVYKDIKVKSLSQYLDSKTSKEIMIYENEIESISKKSLENFNNLEVLSITNNINPAYLEKDLFVNNPNLKSIVIFDFDDPNLSIRKSWLTYLAANKLDNKVNIYFANDIFKFENKNITGFSEKFENEIKLSKLNFNFDNQRKIWSGVIEKEAFKNKNIKEIAPIGNADNNKLLIKKEAFASNDLKFIKLSDNSNFELENNSFASNNINLLKLSNSTNFNIDAFDKKDLLAVSNHYFIEFKHDKKDDSVYASLKSIRKNAPLSQKITLDNSNENNNQLGAFIYPLKEIQSYAFANYNKYKPTDFIIPSSISNIQNNSFSFINKNSTITSYSRLDIESEGFRNIQNIEPTVITTNSNTDLFTSLSDLDINIYNQAVSTKKPIDSLVLNNIMKDINVKEIYKIEFKNQELEELIIPEYINYIHPQAFNGIKPKKIINYSNLNFEDPYYLKSIGISYTNNIIQDIDYDYEKYLLYKVVNNNSITIKGVSQDYFDDNMLFVKIPNKINNMEVTVIEQSAFNNISLQSLIFDKSIDHEILVKRNAFSNNNLEVIKIDEKYIKFEENEVLSAANKSNYKIPFDVFSNNPLSIYIEIINSSDYYSFYTANLFTIFKPQSYVLKNQD